MKDGLDLGSYGEAEKDLKDMRVFGDSVNGEGDGVKVKLVGEFLSYCIVVALLWKWNGAFFPPGCSSELTGVATTEAQLIQIKVSELSYRKNNKNVTGLHHVQRISRAVDDQDIVKNNKNVTRLHQTLFLDNGSSSTRIAYTKPDILAVAKTFVGTETLDGKQINVIEGMKMYEELFDDDSEVGKLVSLANHLRIARRQGKFHGKLPTFGDLDEANCDHKIVIKAIYTGEEYVECADPGVLKLFAHGKPPGVIGWCTSRSVTFLDNHNTGSTQGNRPFHSHHVMEIKVSFRLALHLRREVNHDAVSLITLLKGMFHTLWHIEHCWGLCYTEHIVGMDLTILVCPLISVIASLKRLVLRVGLSIRGATSKRNATWLILPVVICLSQRLAMHVNPLEGKSGASEPRCSGLLVPSVGDALLALIWLGRASWRVTLKKIRVLKACNASVSLAWDYIIEGDILGFMKRTNNCESICQGCFHYQERKVGSGSKHQSYRLVSTINDADQGSADVAYRTPLAPYEKSKFLGSGGSMVARLKLKGIDGRAPPGVEPAA
ncbi:hypothetical protein Tco_0793955 [Tanacetum coccineum]